MMGITRFDITDDERLEDWLGMCMGGQKAEGYRVTNEDGGPVMTLHWTEPPLGEGFYRYNQLPIPLGVRAIFGMVEAWLQDVKRGPRPDTDGSVKKGFRIFNTKYGFVGEERTAFVGIEPVWTVYGK